MDHETQQETAQGNQKVRAETRYRTGEAGVETLAISASIVGHVLRVEPFDQQRIVAHLKRHGVEVGEVRRGPGAGGNGLSVYLSDPEGNSVELRGPSDGDPRTVAGN